MFGSKEHVISESTIATGHIAHRRRMKCHGHARPFGTLETARDDIARAAGAFNEPRSRRTVLALARAQHSPLRRCSGVHCRAWLDDLHLVAATWRCPHPDCSLRPPCRMFVVLLLSRHCMVACGNGYPDCDL